MTEEKHTAMIKELAKSPNTKVQTNIWLRLMQWLFVSALLIVTGVTILGMKHSFASMMTMWDKVIETVALATLAILSSFNAFILSTPGQEGRFQRKKIKYLLIGLGLFFVLQFYFYQYSSLSFKMHFGCAMDILLLGVPSAGLLFFMLSKSANTFPKWSGYLACIAGFSLAAIGSRYTCMDLTSLHFLLWHFLPVVILGMIGFQLGQKLLQL